MTENPLQISLIDLPRQIGSHKAVSLTWVTPADLGTPSMSVEPGTELPIDVTLTTVDGGVLVQLRTQVTLVGECVRCLDPVVRDHGIDAAEVFFETAPKDAEGEEAEDVYLIGARDDIDLEPIVRDAIVTKVDVRPLCAPDCAGLCQGCGEKSADLPQDHAHDVIDPRLAALATWLDSSDEATPGTSDRT